MDQFPRVPTPGDVKTQGLPVHEHITISRDADGFVASLPWTDFTVRADTDDDARRLFGRLYTDRLRESIEERDKVTEFMRAQGPRL